jgi:hypothetical protein
MKYTVLEPVDEPVKTGFALALRPDTLDGKSVGIIDNGKRNSDYVLKKLLERLREKFAVSETVMVKKPSASHGISDEAARDLAGKVQGVIAGIGD